jgi:integrase
LVKQNLGELPMKRARAAAMKTWSGMKVSTPADGAVTLGPAIEQYMEAKALAAKTRHMATYNTDRYLSQWKARTLEEIGRDRAGVRLLQQRITKEHGESSSNQVVRLLSAVYRWHRKVNTELPESPMVVAEIHKIAARDWAYSPDELRAWWTATKKEKDGKKVALGVKTLGTIKRMWWLAALFTGARKGSIEALKWADLDLDKKVIRFRVTKGDRPYSVPMSDALAALLTKYQHSPDVPPSEWVFPSSVIDGAHLIDVKNPNEGVGPAHRLRHTFRTTLAELGASPDQARMLMGHSMGGDVSRGYITTPLVVESLRPIADAVATHYTKIVPGIVE